MLLLIIHAKTPFERIKLAYGLLIEAEKIFLDEASLLSENTRQKQISTR
ncbi:hypothetical protein [Arsenophonus nasoniae]